MRRPVIPQKPQEDTPEVTGEFTDQHEQEPPSEGQPTGAIELDPDPAAPFAFIQRGTWAGRWRVLSRLPLTLMIASVLLGLGIIQLTFQLGNTIYRSVTWKQETQQTQVRVKGLQRDVNILRDAEKAAQDPAYLEQLARCQGYVGRNESVVVAQGAPTTPSENCQTVRLP